MQASKPDYITLNTTRVKVQQWQQLPDCVLLTTLVRGDAPGTALLAELRDDTVMVQWDDSPAQPARPEIMHHRAAGTGPATVHRIGVTLWLATEAEPVEEQSVDAKIDRILRELQELRAEVAQLRGARPTGTSSIAAPLASGRTMLDFEIESDENG